jgi:hypothetical protein
MGDQSSWLLEAYSCNTIKRPIPDISLTDCSEDLTRSASIFGDNKRSQECRYFSGVVVRGEYGNNLEPLFPGIRNAAFEAVLAFAVVTSGVIVVFGFVPLLLKRLISRLRH